MSEYKMYCVTSREALKKMQGIRGKMMAQAGHAFLHAVWDAEDRFPEDVSEYKKSGRAKKVTLVVDTDRELFDLVGEYHKICGVTVVKDAGLTVFKEPTVTCIGIGPLPDDRISDSLKSLKTLT